MELFLDDKINELTFHFIPKKSFVCDCDKDSKNKLNLYLATFEIKCEGVLLYFSFFDELYSATKIQAPYSNKVRGPFISDEWVFVSICS